MYPSVGVIAQVAAFLTFRAGMENYALLLLSLMFYAAAIPCWMFGMRAHASFLRKQLRRTQPALCTIGVQTAFGCLLIFNLWSALSWKAILAVFGLGVASVFMAAAPLFQNESEA